jgi:hypothetical protein
MAKAARTAEEAAAVPIDKPLLLEVESAPVATLDAEPELPLVPPAPTKPVVTEPEPERDEPEEPDDNALTRQLDELRTAEALAKQQLADSQRREQDAIRHAQEQQVELHRERERSVSAEYDSVLNAINALQAQADQAQADLEASLSANDSKGAAEAQRRLTTTSARLVSLEDGKAAWDQRREWERANPPRPQAPADPVTAQIDAMTHLSVKQRDWLKNHRDAMTDQAKNAYLGAAHWDAIRAGHAQDSEAYFAALEEKLGYRQAAAPSAQTERRSPPVSAPVSRESPSLSTGKPTTSRIELTPAQREAARIAGVDEFTYAKGVMRLNDLKKNGHYQERG